MAKKNSWMQKHFSEAQLAEIERAVEKAEQKTAGEVVPVVVRRSQNLDHFAATLAFAFLSLALSLLWFDEFHGFVVYHIELWILTLLGLGFLGIWLGHRPFVQRLLSHKIELKSATLRRAELEFYRNKIAKTKAHTGVLIMISLLERQVVVLADEAIEAKVSQGTWDEVVKLILRGISDENLAQGLCAGIRRAGEILAEHFPSQADDTNELSNKLIVLSD